MKKIVILLTTLLVFFNCGEQTRHSNRTTTENRNQFREKLIHETIEKSLQSGDQSKWSGAFWGMGLAQYRSAVCDSFFQTNMTNLPDYEPGIQRGVLEVVYGLYPSEFHEEITHLIHKTDNPKLFAMMANYLIRNDQSLTSEIKQMLVEKFPNWQQNGILISLHHDVSENNDELPSLTDLLTHNFNNKPVIFSFHRQNRDYQGLTIIRKDDGEFLRDEFGHLFHIPHLARSNSALPSYITNGNSPQGIYAILGTGQSDNVFIGPCKNLQLRMPFEAKPKYFDHSEKSVWTKDIYKHLLPKTWQDYFPIYGTYYAGMAGRSAIIAHGTTIDPEFYKCMPFYPNTPSLGCITATELWSEETGELIYSDQQALAQAWESLKTERGYFVLIEIDNKQRDVTLNDVLPIITKCHYETLEVSK